MYHKGNDGSPVHGLAKRRPEMGAQGFTGDSFNGESWDKQNQNTQFLLSVCPAVAFVADFHKEM